MKQFFITTENTKEEFTAFYEIKELVVDITFFTFFGRQTVTINKAELFVKLSEILGELNGPPNIL